MFYARMLNDMRSQQHHYHTGWRVAFLRARGLRRARNGKVRRLRPQ